MSNFSDLSKRIVYHFKKVGYVVNIMKQASCLAFNPFMVDSYAALFSCAAMVQASDSMAALT